MKDNVYRIFILSSAKASICMVTVMWTDWTNCSFFSWLPSKGSGLATLAFLISWPPAGTCMLVRIICATADAGGCIGYVVWSIQNLSLQVIVGHLELCDQLRLIVKKFA